MSGAAGEQRSDVATPRSSTRESNPAAAATSPASPRRYTNRDGTVVDFADDEWRLTDLLKPTVYRAFARLSFTDLPAWLQHDGKRWLWHLWRERGLALLTLQTARTALAHLARSMPNRSAPATALGMREGKLVAAYFVRIANEYRRNATAGRTRHRNRHGTRGTELSPLTALQNAMRISQFAAFLRAQADGGGAHGFTIPCHGISPRWGGTARSPPSRRR